jgi:hypothetical protein
MNIQNPEFSCSRAQTTLFLQIWQILLLPSMSSSSNNNHLHHQELLEDPLHLQQQELFNAIFVTESSTLLKLLVVTKMLTNLKELLLEQEPSTLITTTPSMVMSLSHHHNNNHHLHFHSLNEPKTLTMSHEQQHGGFFNHHYEYPYWQNLEMEPPFLQFHHPTNTFPLNASSASYSSTHHSNLISSQQTLIS